MSARVVREWTFSDGIVVLWPGDPKKRRRKISRFVGKREARKNEAGTLEDPARTYTNRPSRKTNILLWCKNSQRRATKPAAVEFALPEKLPTAIGSNAAMWPDNTGSERPLRLSSRERPNERTHTDLRISTVTRGVFKNQLNAMRSERFLGVWLETEKFDLKISRRLFFFFLLIDPRVSSPRVSIVPQLL